MRRKITMNELLAGNLEGITLEDIHYNGFGGEIEYTQPGKSQIRVACIGDSITYGHGIYNWPKENYPSLLGKLLGDKFHVQNFGVCGRCVQDFSDQPYREEPQYRKSLAYQPNWIVFMMGTNDSKPENWHGTAAFGQSLRLLLDDYQKGNAQVKLVLCTPAAAFYTEGCTGSKTQFDVQPTVVEQIVRVTKDVARERKLPVIDIHALTERNPEWFKTDGVHPDNSGAAAIAKEIYEFIQRSTGGNNE